MSMPPEGGRGRETRKLLSLLPLIPSYGEGRGIDSGRSGNKTWRMAVRKERAPSCGSVGRRRMFLFLRLRQDIRPTLEVLQY